MRTFLMGLAGWIIGTWLGILYLESQPDTRTFKCSHEYSYFKSDEAFVITQVSALNECEE